ncbi:EscU/YscU/HrcU family type III secretion system export apparatus switch protein [Succinimonas amylolytica]|uniref:EscU/YscU/HrcU family type III secretion system export apparatus switch protein n=1 Tax=Succinimonas amylolytica TaxID=83769 RepID=UPI00037E296C|nr:EscU/YscU/HrcU family type III secretion system export apparatus switch protein [Succinimonas amylolytica]
MNDRKNEPVRYAVALDYDAEKDPLPVILAKGEGDLARRMIEAAREEKIPIMREAPLARALFEEGREDEYVPEDLILQIAEVLRFVKSLEDS